MRVRVRFKVSQPFPLIPLTVSTLSFPDVQLRLPVGAKQYLLSWSISV